MSRYRGPKIRIVRRLGELPGLTNKTTTRETLPGQHRKVRGKQNNVSSYAVRLQEKQNCVIIMV
jgi:small subunit ribosomal protein S4